MKKVFYNTKIIFILLLICSCEKKKTSIEKAIHYSENLKEITDSLNKFKSYNIDLLICRYSEDSLFGKLKLEVPNIPYHVNTPHYGYKKINNIDILFIDNLGSNNLSEAEKQKLMNNEIIGDNYYRIKHLIDSGKITFGHQFTNHPFVKFIFYNNDTKKINCFDNMMESDAYYEAYKDNKEYNESTFYPSQ